MLCPAERLKAWLQLLRVPNLLTVPGDPLAGFLLARLTALSEPSMTAVLAPIAASLCLYAFGLVLNDLADIEEDRRDRPDRPLPSGRVSRAGAWVAALLLAAGGMFAAFQAGRTTLLIAVVLLATVTAYDMFLKRVPVLGPFAMGLCRALSLLLGASAVDPGEPPGVFSILASMNLLFYVTSVTVIAGGETRSHAIGRLRWAPAFVLTVFPAILIGAWNCGYRRPSGASLEVMVPALAFSIIAIWIASRAGAALGGEPRADRTQRAVGTLIGNLLLIQAAMASLGSCAGLMTSLFLALAYPIFLVLAHRFYSS